jgi:hypothetical protein
MFMMMLAAMSGPPASSAGPIPVVSGLSTSSYQSGICNKGTLEQTYKIKLSWSITNLGSAGYALQVFVNGAFQTALADTALSYIYDTGTAGLSAHQGDLTFAVKVVLVSSGAVLQTASIGPSLYNLGGCS